MVHTSVDASFMQIYSPGLRITHKGSNLLGQAIVAEVLCHLKLVLTALSHHSIALAPVQLPNAPERPGHVPD